MHAHAYLQTVKQECRALAASKQSSAFRVTSINKLKTLDLTMLENELASKAPVLCSVLNAASTHSKSKDACRAYPLMAASILLKARNRRLCLLQSIIGAILYTGHASKVVCWSTIAYIIFRLLMMCIYMY